jgi:hypothetical protein
MLGIFAKIVPIGLHRTTTSNMKSLPLENFAMNAKANKPTTLVANNKYRGH